MWIDIFELTNGDIESVVLYWDKQICYEATFAREEGIDEKGYVGDDDMGLGRHRIIEIKDGSFFFKRRVITDGHIATRFLMDRNHTFKIVLVQPVIPIHKGNVISGSHFNPTVSCCA